MLKNQIKLDKEVEIQKENLFSNLKFNTIDAFKLFDKDGNNYITIDEFQAVIDSMSIAASADKILLKIMRYDKDNDNRIDYQEFLRIITPKNDQYILTNDPRHYSSNPSNYNKAVEDSQDLADFEWIEDLKEVLLTNSKAEEILLDIRRALNIDGD